MIARFEVKIESLSDGCWLWKGGRQVNGYGVFAIAHAQIRRAHRVAYELFIGPIPDGLTIDHICRRRDCVNPTHLEAVSLRENLLRANGWAGRNARATSCPAGHEYSLANTYRRPDGQRDCRECARIYQRERRRRRQEEAA